MKIDVTTPDFCPDNCINAEIENTTLYSDAKQYHTTFKCTKEPICRNLYRQLNRSEEK